MFFDFFRGFYIVSIPKLISSKYVRTVCMLTYSVCWQRCVDTVLYMQSAHNVHGMPSTVPVPRLGDSATGTDAAAQIHGLV
jgi:hypothetical protein